MERVLSSFIVQWRFSLFFCTLLGGLLSLEYRNDRVRLKQQDKASKIDYLKVGSETYIFQRLLAPDHYSLTHVPIW